jgi:antitoxin (DNA-binding transcriptional repressor) of toxin-antitoxin stability system
MKTLTITEGRGRLGYWLKKAAQGEDIGFMFEGKVVALRPVEVYSASTRSHPRFGSLQFLVRSI